MAVTYAWRLDANKYSYIISPDNGLAQRERYGYVSNTPLTGSQLQIVADDANFFFGEGATNGSSEYAKAFNTMYNKIVGEMENKWSDLESLDLLSADVYYNVDAPSCADLRGVGIKGVKYLGGILPDENALDNLDITGWNPNISQAAAGTYSVYGIFMEDQEISYDDNGNLETTPENVFVVYNGLDGSPSSGGTADSYVTDAEFDSAVSDLQTSINSMNNAIDSIRNDLNELASWDNGDNSGSILNISDRLDELEGLTEELDKNLNNLASIVATINNVIGSGGGDNTTILERISELEHKVVTLEEQIDSVSFNISDIPDDKSDSVFSIVLYDNDGNIYKSSVTQQDNSIYAGGFYQKLQNTQSEE